MEAGRGRLIVGREDPRGLRGPSFGNGLMNESLPVPPRFGRGMPCAYSSRQLGGSSQMSAVPNDPQGAFGREPGVVYALRISTNGAERDIQD